MRFSILVLVIGLAGACSSKPKTVETPNVTEAAASTNTTPVVKSVEKALDAATAAARAECTTKGDSRILELRPKGKGCELAYTKNGQEGVVASSGNGSAYCEATMNKIRDRLKGAGFDCK